METKMGQNDFSKMMAEAIAEGVKAVVDPIMEKQNQMLDEMMKSINEQKGKALTATEWEGIFAGAKTVSEKGDSYEPGVKFARWIKAVAVAKRDDTSVENAIKTIYVKDASFVDEATKAIEVGGDGGSTVPEDYLNEIIPLLYAKTVVKELGARIVPMPGGNLNIPKLVTGTDATYIGEGQKKNEKKPVYTNVKLSAKKLVSKVVISNDILRSGSLLSDMFVRDDMIRQMQLKMDSVALFGSGSAYEPLGIDNTANVEKSTVGALPNATNITAPVSAVEGNDAVGDGFGWAFHPTFKWVLYNVTDGAGNFIFREELNKGLLLGYPYKTTTQIPVGTTGKNVTKVFFGDWNEWMIGDQLALEVSASKEATYNDESGNLVSAFDNDQTVIKGLMIHDMKASHGQVFAVYTFDTIA